MMEYDTHLTDSHLRFQLCCIDQYLNKKSFLYTTWFCFNLTSFTSALSWTFIELAKIVLK